MKQTIQQTKKLEEELIQKRDIQVVFMIGVFVTMKNRR